MIPKTFVLKVSATIKYTFLQLWFYFCCVFNSFQFPVVLGNIALEDVMNKGRKPNIPVLCLNPSIYLYLSISLDRQLQMLSYISVA